MNSARCLVKWANAGKLLPGKAASGLAEHERMNGEWLVGGQGVALSGLPLIGWAYLAAPFNDPVVGVPEAPPIRQTISLSLACHVSVVG